MKIAIVGASKDRSKYGNKAVRAYKLKDHVVFPVNPHERIIEGLKCYNNLLEIPFDVDVVLFYVPPIVGLKIVDDVIKKKIKNVFLNSGTSSPEIVENLKQKKIKIIVGCSIRDIGINPDEL
jgi:uncharacterized protein